MGKITPSFGFHSNASAVIEGIDLTGKSAMVTGGASGIGIETVLALARAGATVTVAVRRPEAAEPVVAELRHSTAKQNIHLKTVDLSDRHSVEAFTEACQGLLHILLNNPGRALRAGCRKCGAPLGPRSWDAAVSATFAAAQPDGCLTPPPCCAN